MTTTIVPERLAQLDEIHLDSGGHPSFDQGHCAMEVVAWLAGAHDITDAPECASPVLRGYVIRLNDRWSDEQRQLLKPFLPRMVGTAGDGQDPARMALAQRALLFDLLPAWLALAGMDEEIAPLQALTDRYEVRKALYGIRDRAWAKRAASLDQLRAKVRERLAGRPAAAAAAADAVAAAVAAAAAAAADAAAVAAAAAAAADADADAAAAAAADAAADAVAAAAGKDPYWPTYYAVKKAITEAIEKSVDPVMVKARALGVAQQQIALDLLEAMIDPASNAA